MRPMRVLHVTPELPYFPGGSGGSTRQFKLLADLVRRGHSVDVVAPVAPDQRDGAGSLADAGIALHALHRPDNRIAETATTIARHPSLLLDAVRLPLLAWQVEVFWRALQTPLKEAVLGAAEVPDVIVVEHDWAARWWRDLPAGIPLALTLENLSWRYYDLRAAAATGWLRTASLRREGRRFKRFDRDHLDRYNVLLAMSELDRDEVASVSSARCEVIPNGVDTTAIPAHAPGAAPVAVFVGSMAYPPNTEALRWLLRELWPRVIERLPAAELLVVGRDVPPDLTTSPPRGVTFTGFIPDMRDVYARARTALCPMLSGAGTRLKVIEGLATGLPLVSTTMGAEGVAVTDGADVLLADGADAFAETVVRALTDDALAARIGAGGRALAESTYDWATIGGRLEQVLASIARS